jgi:UDP-N-acetylglucosamine--N-acetylmuramyl-(pentapeptide) pyrophosphoryl-undecaprenol N-acetylglucosamine transferase
VIIFFTSPIGLGHATRDVAICENLCSLKREEVFFVSGWPAIDIFLKNGYIAYNAYKPHKFNVSNSMELRSVLRWALQYLLYYRKCKAIASDFIDKNKNGLIVSDEDFASISIGENRNRKRILITDLVGTKFVKGLFSNIELRMNRSMLNMIKKCDRVIIPDYGENRDNISPYWTNSAKFKYNK